MIMIHHREEIRKAARQDGLRTQLGIGSAFTQKELKTACDRLFRVWPKRRAYWPHRIATQLLRIL